MPTQLPQPRKEVVWGHAGVVVPGEIVQRCDQRAQHLIEAARQGLGKAVFLIQGRQECAEGVRRRQPGDEGAHRGHADSTRTWCSYENTSELGATSRR